MVSRSGCAIGAGIAALVVCSALVLAGTQSSSDATAPASPPEGSGVAPSDAAVIPGDTVNLAEVVKGWPAGWTASGTKSEPQYVEHLAFGRRGDDFSLDIALVAQGSQAGGHSSLAVHVAADGVLTAVGDCASGCATNSVRGFLTTATLLSRSRTGSLPERATVRAFGEHEVVCVSDAALFPLDDPFFLDPCFDLATGAVLAHFSSDRGGFAGATLNPESARVVVSTTS